MFIGKKGSLPENRLVLFSTCSLGGRAFTLRIQAQSNWNGCCFRVPNPHSYSMDGILRGLLQETSIEQHLLPRPSGPDPSDGEEASELS